MTDIFDQSVASVLREEGGYVNDSHDPGGETNFGISHRAYPDLEISALTADDAKEIYRRDYWEKIRGDDLSPPVAFYLLDSAVNLGIRAATRLLQRAEGITEDGILGPETVMVAGPSALPGLHAARLAYYRALGGFPRYGKGWLARATRVLAEAQRVAA